MHPLNLSPAICIAVSSMVQPMPFILGDAEYMQNSAFMLYLWVNEWSEQPASNQDAP